MFPPHVTRALNRLETLGAISDDPRFRLRTLLSPASRRAALILADWFREAGLKVDHTLDGSVRGILPGKNPTAPALLLGSHFDTVIDAGAYDGPLGILSALAALEGLQSEGIELPFPIHILAFSDEEGVRFQTTFIGSLGMVADLDAGRLATCDRTGQPLSSVLAAEGWHEDAVSIRYTSQNARGYLELHIEQGRVLEERNLAASAVSALVGQTRLKATLLGQADHAGTTPMTLRRDALAGAAQCITAIEAIASDIPEAVATVGQLEVHPGASNAIPQSATFSIDLRHPSDAKRTLLRERIEADLQVIASDRSLNLQCQTLLCEDATPCDATLSADLLDSVEAVTGERASLVSGAGHDGIVFARVMPIAMVFVRCREGLSHHPAEYASPEDIATGIAILTHYLRNQALKHHA